MEIVTERFTGPVKRDRERNFSLAWRIYGRGIGFREGGLFTEGGKGAEEAKRLTGGAIFVSVLQPTDPPIPRYTIRYACRHPHTLVIPSYDVDGGGGKTSRENETNVCPSFAKLASPAR